MKLFNTLLFIAFILINQNVFSQNSYNLPPNKFYSQATLGFKNFEKKKVKDLKILEDSLVYSVSEIGYSSSFEEINYIRIKKGTKAGSGALLGGGSMLILSLISILNVQTDPDYELKENAGQTLALFTMGGAAVGGIIGSAIIRETSYYLHVKKID
ncbi:MAG: hypothetical protein ACFHWX_02460 [Bacteroidota bacterium]